MKCEGETEALFPFFRVTIDYCHCTIESMIRNFRHGGLKKMYEGDPSRIDPKLRERARRILLSLSAAESPEDMASPGYQLHPLKGSRKGAWAVSVNQNWRITFRFQGSLICDVDLVDYH